MVHSGPLGPQFARSVHSLAQIFALFGTLHTQTSNQTNKQHYFYRYTPLTFGRDYCLHTPKCMTRQESLDSSDMTVGGYTSLWR